jgi:hypothetical protein
VSKPRKLLGYCHALRLDRRCGAPAYRTYATDWLACDRCLGNGRFEFSCSLLTVGAEDKAEGAAPKEQGAER